MKFTFSRIIDLMRAFSLLSAAALAIDFLRHPSAVISYQALLHWAAFTAYSQRSVPYISALYLSHAPTVVFFFSIPSTPRAYLPVFSHTAKVGDVISRLWWHFIPLELARALH